MTEVDIIRGDRMKEGDTLPDLRVQLIEDGDPINLTGFTVSVKMKPTDGDTLTVDTNATITNQSRGIVGYSWSAGETDKPGMYLLEFVADDGSGNQLTFPNEGQTTIFIEEQL